MGICYLELHIVLISRRAAANAAVVLWHLSKYSVPLNIKDYHMTLLEVSLGVMENSCRIQLISLKRIDK